MKKIFAVADVHGYFKEMKKALDDAGYDSENPDHLLVTIGDMFDRGEESLAIYEFLYPLEKEGKAICLKGNHTNFFLDYLTGESITYFNFFYNGTGKTFDDFLHRTNSFMSWCMVDKGIEKPIVADFADFIKYARNEVIEEYPELIPWLKARPYYFETKHYIFTHSGIDTKVKNWKKPKKRYHSFTGWEACIWDIDFFGEEINNTDKVVVIGHTHTRELRRKFHISHTRQDKDDMLIRDDKKVIALDACTTVSKKVNVLVVEDDLK